MRNDAYGNAATIAGMPRVKKNGMIGMSAPISVETAAENAEVRSNKSVGEKSKFIGIVPNLCGSVNW